MEFQQKKPAAPAGAPAVGISDVIKESSTAAFAKDVLETSRTMPVLVDFWAPWCGPCKQLTPIIEKVVKSYAGKVRLVKINIDEHPAVASQLRMQSIPTVYAFRDGRPIDGFVGPLPEGQVRAFVDRLLGEDQADDVAGAIEEADKLLETGDVQSAAEIYASILQEDRENIQALAGLARCYVKTGDLDRAEQTLGLVPPAKRDAHPLQGLRAAIDLARRGTDPGKLEPLRAKVAADPADHQARIDLAVGLAASGDKSGAVTELLESFRRDRNWGDQAARKQLVQLFDAWGAKDEATLDGRRRLSSMLFS